jgi:hypothetical protein
VDTVDPTNNAQAVVDAKFAEAQRGLQLGERSGWDSLVGFCQSGRAFIDIKAILPHGQFGRQVEARCRCSRQWRTQLMKLARQWPDVENAFAWARANNHALKFSVDGALALAAKWRREMTGTGSERPSQTRRTSRRSDEAEELRRQLRAARAEVARAHARIRILETELSCRNGTLSRTFIDPKTKALAEKVGALWHRGVGGERLCAEQRLRAMAERLGRSMREFVAECGLKCPADWTDPDAQPRAT